MVYAYSDLEFGKKKKKKNKWNEGEKEG